MIQFARVPFKQGLHSRPALVFAQIARKYDADVIVEYNGRRVIGKNPIDLLKLNAVEGSILVLHAHGDDEKELLESLREFLKQ